MNLFDRVVERFGGQKVSFSEHDALADLWAQGEDGYLREDQRFRETPWGRWMLAEDLVANDAIYRWLLAERRSTVELAAVLERAGQVYGRRCVFCTADPRFVLRHDAVHLAASELSRQPVVEDEVGDLEKYRTHLPLHSLKAAAASEPAGEWGRRAQDQVIETLGWVRVSLPGRRLNDRMFIAAIEGHSMDDGKSGLVDGGYAVFELWPSGTKQNLSVLVRGAFSDPETGNYAVKKYVGDQRDEDGRHNKVSLVSLNPDKNRYPNIELAPEDDDDVTVVAKVVQALAADDYERRPKPRRLVGRRNLTDTAQASSLGRRIAAFFDGAEPDTEDEDLGADQNSGWQTRLVCLEVAAGGLQLEVGPLVGLPAFVKKLRVVGTDWDAIVLAANAKTRPARTSVRPASGPWRWEAVGFEEEQDLGLDKLAVDALDWTLPTVFRVDADGVGQRTKSTTLALGQLYRLLLPPKVGGELGAELDDGWRIWSIELDTEVSTLTRQRLTSLGLAVSEAWPRLEWALCPPAAWQWNPRGQSYAVFEAGSDLFVRVGGLLLQDGDEAAVFLHGPSGTERFDVATNVVVSLGAPQAGQWACTLVHSQTTVPVASLFLQVIEAATEHIAASWSVAAPGGLMSLEATAPPGWPVSVHWRVFAGREEPLATVHADIERTLPVEAIVPLLKDRAANTRVADVVVDFKELGHRVLAHDGRVSLKHVRERLQGLWQQRAALVQSRKGAWLQLRSLWFEPVTQLLGYGLDQASLITHTEVPHEATAWLLTVDERAMGSITRSPARVLVLTTDLDAVLCDHRQLLDDACSAARVRDAILTDGANWTTHRKGSHQLKQEVWNLQEVISLGRIDDMLGDLAEGL